MIREERNALILLLTFLVASGILYYLVVRPALHDALPQRTSSASSDAGPDDGVRTEDSATSAGPQLVQPDREARRLVTVRARVRDAIDGSIPADLAADVLGVADIAEPISRLSPEGDLVVEYLPPSVSFALRVHAPGYRPAFFPRLRDEARALIELGEVPLTPKRSWRGTVIDERRQAVAGAYVGLYPLRPAPFDASRLDRAASVAESLLAAPFADAESDTHGRFEFEDLAPDHYVVYVALAGRTPALLPDLDLTGPTSQGLVVLSPGTSVQGKVRVADEGPYAGGRVALIEDGIAIDGQLSGALIETDDHGEFRVGALKGVPHYLFADHAAVAATGLGPYDPRGGEWRTTLEPGFAISGRVTGPDGRPEPGAHVRARARRPGARWIAGIAGPDGRYRLDRMPFGSAWVEVIAARRAADRRAVPVGTIGAVHDVRLLEEGVVRGTVHSVRGEPIVGATVRALGGMLTAGTRSDGRFELRGLPAASIQLVAEASGFTPATETVAVRLRDENPREIVLSDATRLFVQLRGADGHDLPGGRVIALTTTSRGDPVVLAEARADQDALAALTLIDRGRPLRLMASAPAHSPVRSAPIESLDDAERVGLTLGLKGAIQGTVTVDGRPVPRAVVQVESIDPDPFEAVLIRVVGNPTLSADDGSYRVDGLPQGTFRVLAYLPGVGAARLEPVAVLAGRTAAGQELRIAARDPVVGFVRAGGTPEPGASVTLDGLGDDGAIVVRMRCDATDADGRFEFAPLPTPSYRLSVTTLDGRDASIDVTEPSSADAPCVLEVGS